MNFDPPLKQAILLRRYKRFLADIRVGEGIETVHCANTGAMHGCSDPMSRVWYSTSSNPRRKLQHSLEIVETSQGHRVCVNTARANQLVAEALETNSIPELSRLGTWRREVGVPDESGRFDFGTDGVVMEVKMVSWLRNGVGVFPDATSVRAARHVESLKKCAQRGMRAILLYCVPHSGVDSVTTASDIDPTYSEAISDAVADGVDVLAYRWSVSATNWLLDRELPFVVED